MSPESNRRLLQKAALEEHFTAVARSADALRHSLAKCSVMGLEAEFTLDELDHFEALSARFARTADLYTQKLLRSVFIVIGEDAASQANHRYSQVLRIHNQSTSSNPTEI